MPLNPPIQDWTKTTVWTIGASSGIGEALVHALSEKGCTQLVSARSAQKLHNLANSLPNVVAVPLDITQKTSIQTALTQPIMEHAQLDVVVLMAGTYSEMNLDAFNLEKIETQIKVNLLGTYQMLAAILPRMMAAKQGHICIVSSVAGYRGLPNALAYGPSKAALINLAEALYLECKPHGIGVSLVCPGFVDTPLTQKNTFPMPFLMSASSAAKRIVQGLERGVFEMHFPKRFTWGLKLLRCLPYRLYFALLSKAGLVRSS